MTLLSFFARRYISLVFLITQICLGSSESFTREMLRVWKRFTGDFKFDDEYFWVHMDVCLQAWSTQDLDLSKINDNYWKGLVEYGEKGGGTNGSDPWGAIQAPFIEYNPTPLVQPKYISEFPNMPLNSSEILVAQPCNTVSNLAYYKTMIAVCETGRQWTFSDDTLRALVRSALPLGIGSTLYHASQTELGYWFDVEGIGHWFWASHQGMLQDIPYDSILHDLSEQPSNFSALTLVANVSKVVQDLPVDMWLSIVETLTGPWFFFTVASGLATIIDMVFPTELADFVMEILASILLRESEFEFVKQKYIPKLRQAFMEASVNLEIKTRVGLFFKLSGSGIKLLNGVLWQENFIDFFHLNSKIKNFLGAVTMPGLNVLANKMTGFDRKNDKWFQLAHGAYPGERMCRKTVAHAKWHEMTANGLADLVFLYDEVARVIQAGGAVKTLDIAPNHLLDCQMQNDCYSGFDWSMIAPFSSQAFASCSKMIGSSLPDLDAANSDFVGCMINTMVRVGNSDDVALEKRSSSTETVDQCLVENDCIGFNGMQLDILKLDRCIGLGSIFGSPCSSTFRQMPMAMCLLFCRGDSFCSTGCLQKHATLSPWIDSAISCVSALGRTDGNDVVDKEAQQACLEKLHVNLPLMNAFQAEVVQGLSSVAICSAQKCGAERLEFTESIRSINKCTKACNAVEETNGIFSSGAIKGAACALNCTLSNI